MPGFLDFIIEFIGDLLFGRHAPEAAEPEGTRTDERPAPQPPARGGSTLH